MALAVREFMSTDYPSVGIDDNVVEIAKRMARVASTVPVIDGRGTFRGVVTMAQIVRQVAAESDLEATTADQLAMAQRSIGPDEPLAKAAQMLAEHALSIVPVTESGRLDGVITYADVEAFRQLGEQLGPRLAQLDTRISPQDTMRGGLRGHYFVAGSSALRCVHASLSSAGRSSPKSVLDLPSGYGRVLRVLQAAYPNARFTACDIDRNAVDFCGGVLGATPVYSEDDPAKIQLNEKFDLIWVGSLFTHLPARRWRGFLDFFADHLTPAGLLIFTTLHDFISAAWVGISEQRGEEMLGELVRSGYAYLPQFGEDFGISLASPQWIKAQIDDHPRLRLHRLDEDAWQPVMPRHDVTTCLLGDGTPG
jgi:CBS domain-containing protein